jgi:glucose/arabinose dehydrogenase
LPHNSGITIDELYVKLYRLAQYFTAITLLFWGAFVFSADAQKVTTVVGNLDTVWGIDFLPDGSMIFTERPGRVSTFKKGVKSVVGQIGIEEKEESGLMGIAVDPDFSTNKYIYIIYTRAARWWNIDFWTRWKTGVVNRISRFVFDATLKQETILLDGIPAAWYHDGGGLAFGPDGKLYATTGDAIRPKNAQDRNSLAGKILRLNKDGSIPSDNPFGNYLWSYGHRNPQGIAWHSSGNMYESEHGPTRHDEVNLIVKGGNYGWPNTCGSGSGRSPIKCYIDQGHPPAGIAIYKNSIFVAGLGSKKVRKLELDRSLQNVVSDEEFITGLGRTRALKIHDGFLYIGTSNLDGRGNAQSSEDDRIVRIKLK